MVRPRGLVFGRERPRARHLLYRHGRPKVLSPPQLKLEMSTPTPPTPHKQRQSPTQPNPDDALHLQIIIQQPLSNPPSPSPNLINPTPTPLQPPLSHLLTPIPPKRFSHASLSHPHHHRPPSQGLTAKGWCGSASIRDHLAS